MTLRFPLLPRLARCTIVLGLVVFIFYVSILTTPPETPIDRMRFDLLPLDKWRHFLAYAALGGSLAYTWEHGEAPTRNEIVGVFLATVCYGVLIEFGQALRPARYFSLTDAYANALGALLSLVWYAVRPYLDFVPVSSFIDDTRPGAT